MDDRIRRGGGIKLGLLSYAGRASEVGRGLDFAPLARFVGTGRTRTGFRKETQPEGDTIAPGKQTMTAPRTKKQ